MSFVVLGNFNPAIFHPEWFGRHELIRQEEATHAHIDILATELCQFTTEWFGLQVIAEKLVLESSDPTKWLPLRDLLSTTFRLLEHTPIKAFGFNAHMHVALESPQKWEWGVDPKQFRPYHSLESDFSFERSARLDYDAG